MAHYNELCHQCPTSLRRTMRKRERGEALYNCALDYNFVIPTLVVFSTIYMYTQVQLEASLSFVGTMVGSASTTYHWHLAWRM